MGDKTIEDLVRHVYKMYKEPSPYWSKAHFEKRCIQLHAAETILLRCFDSPFSDPIDIVDGYLMEVYMMKRANENEYAAKMLNIIESTLNDILRYLS